MYILYKTTLRVLCRVQFRPNSLDIQPCKCQIADLTLQGCLYLSNLQLEGKTYRLLRVIQLLKLNIIHYLIMSDRHIPVSIQESVKKQSICRSVCLILYHNTVISYFPCSSFGNKRYCIIIQNSIAQKTRFVVVQYTRRQEGRYRYVPVPIFCITGHQNSNCMLFFTWLKVCRFYFTQINNHNNIIINFPTLIRGSNIMPFRRVNQIYAEYIIHNEWHSFTL